MNTCGFFSLQVFFFIMLESIGLNCRAAVDVAVRQGLTYLEAKSYCFNV